LAVGESHLRARLRVGHQPARGRSRHGRLARREHTGRHRSDPLGPRIPGHQALQLRLPVLWAADDHGHPQTDAGVHRQPGAAVVLRHQELQRDQHRRGSWRACQRDLQRMRGPHSRTSNYARKDHRGVESTGSAGMKNISIYRPTTIEQAIQLLSRHGHEAGVYAGGTDLLIRLKNGLSQAPTYLVDIKKIDNLRYIKDDAQGGVRIGALTKLSEMVESDLLAKKYPMLVKAIGMISSPELRNASTLGGALLQEVWCQYLRGGYSCWRHGGYILYGASWVKSFYPSAL